MVVVVALVTALSLGVVGGPHGVQEAQAAPDLTVTPLTWNIIGLDSNRPADGPRHFPVGARVCSEGEATSGPVVVDFIWNDPDGSYIYLRPGSLGHLTFPALAADQCVDAYFEVEVNPIAASYLKTRRYTITATSGAETASTPQPRELFVEYLISQNRNATTDVRFGTTPANLASVPPGGGDEPGRGPDVYY